MASLNLKHLRYFWTVARAGSIARASAQLHITPQSISSQLTELEHTLDTRLLRRQGRGLELTEIGRRVADYAEEIFSIEEDLLALVRQQDKRVAQAFRVGVADSVPKSFTSQVLEPALNLDEPVRLVCREGGLVDLLAELAVHRLDLVIADRPLPTDLKVRAFSHLLGTSDVSVFGAPGLVRTLKGKFPALLNDAPLLLPGRAVAVRPQFEQWLEAHHLRPRVVGEFDDSALMKAFGQRGAGLFIAPTALADYVSKQYAVRAVGRIEAVTEHFYAISTERRLKHPAVLSISEAASRRMLGGPAPKRSGRSRTGA